ncbi:MAG: methyl-accepting chemotaxis protein [Kofleriaceae bacterium]
MTDDTRNSSPARIAFAPAILVLNRLRYAAKFALIGLLVLLPFGVVTFLQYRGATKQIEFNSAEAEGVAYLRELNSLLEAQQRYWILLAASQGGVNLGDRITAATTDIGRAINQVDELDARFGDKFKTRAKWASTKAAWEKAVAGRNLGDVGVAVQATATLFTDVGNGSNLILDPDLDSYWLMDAVVTRTPSLGTTIGLLATGVLPTTSALKPEQLVELAGLYKIAQNGATDLKNINIATAIAETKNYGNSTGLATLNAPVTDLQTSVSKFATSVSSNYFTAAAADAVFAPNRTAIFDAALDSIKLVRGVTDQIFPYLQALIEKRVENYRSDRATGLAVAVIASLLLLYIFIGFYFAVRGSVDNLRTATRRMIAGTNETFADTARDEIGDITIAYNEINNALVAARALQSQVQAENDDIQRNIVDLLQVVSSASDGDLTVRAATTAGTIGNVADALNLLLESLQDLIGEVANNATSTSTAVSTIANAAETMAEGATSQTKEMLAARQLVKNVASQLQDVSKTAVAAANSAQRTESSAVDGVRAVETIVSGMDGLRASVQAGAKKMKNLGDRSMEITGIVNTISKISEQTNMLALNAAIEAARAGDQGLGFSVVADEVRKLAERSAAATKDIELLVRTIHAETSETVQTVEHQATVVEQEALAVGSAGDSLRQIQLVSTEAAKIVTQISSTAQVQSDQVNDVVATMDRISMISLETQKSAQNTQATTGELMRAAASLTSSIAKFRIRA